MPCSYRSADKTPTFLDKLKDNGLLGSDMNDIRDRYDAGMHLHALWYGFNASGKSTFDLIDKPAVRYETEEETEADRMQQKYKDVMTALPVKYRECAHKTCVEGLYCGSLELIIDMLDALWAALDRVRKKEEYP